MEILFLGLQWDNYDLPWALQQLHILRQSKMPGPTWNVRLSLPLYPQTAGKIEPTYLSTYGRMVTVQAPGLVKPDSL